MSELELHSALRILWSRKWTFAFSAVTVFALVVAYALLAQPRYSVLTKLVPRASADQAGGLQSLVGQFGGLAALAGMSIGGGGEDNESLEWFKSRAFLERFIEKNNLIPVLFPKAWHSKKNAWIENLDPEDIPTIDDAYNVFSNIRRVSQDARTGVISQEIVWADRELAAKWANQLVEQANVELRNRAATEADASLKFLETELKKTSVIELQQAIYRLMEAQVKRKLLANIRPDYAFAVIDPAVPPDADRFVSPKRRILLLVSFPFALISAGIGVIALHFFLSLFVSVGSTQRQAA